MPEDLPFLPISLNEVVLARQLPCRRCVSPQSFPVGLILFMWAESWGRGCGHSTEGFPSSRSPEVWECWNQGKVEVHHNTFPTSPSCDASAPAPGAESQQQADHGHARLRPHVAPGTPGCWSDLCSLSLTSAGCLHL